jgi:hypothetical protein
MLPPGSDAPKIRPPPQLCRVAESLAHGAPQSPLPAPHPSPRVPGPGPITRPRAPGPRASARSPLPAPRALTSEPRPRVRGRRWRGRRGGGRARTCPAAAQPGIPGDDALSARPRRCGEGAQPGPPARWRPLRGGRCAAAGPGARRGRISSAAAAAAATRSSATSAPSPAPPTQPAGAAQNPARSSAEWRAHRAGGVAPGEERGDPGGAGHGAFCTGEGHP